MKKYYGLVGLGLVGCWGITIGLVQAQGDLGGDRASISGQEGSLRHGNLTRHFRYYAPANLPANAPVVVLLHGGNQSMRQLFKERAGGSRAWPALAQQQQFLLIVPNGVNSETGDTDGDRQSWNDCRQQGEVLDRVDDVGFIGKLIDWAGERYRVDRRRIYVTGASNGGMMSQRLGIELGQRVAAIASFIGNLPDPSECRAARGPVPVMLVNGTADPVVPWAGGQVAGGETKVVSTLATVDYWLRVNGVEGATPIVTQLPNLNRRDRSRVISNRYESGAKGAPVWFYRVEGGGHTMPSVQYEVPQFLQRRLVGNQNRDVEGAEAAWSFLSRQRLNRIP
jgi:polyhydroxybutyrate depolymerase